MPIPMMLTPAAVTLFTTFLRCSSISERGPVPAGAPSDRTIITFADSEGKSKGYGFVHYETMEMAQNAIASVNNMLLNERQVFVGLHVSRKERQTKMDEMKSMVSLAALCPTPLVEMMKYATCYLTQLFDDNDFCHEKNYVTFFLISLLWAKDVFCNDGKRMGERIRRPEQTPHPPVPL